MSEALDSENLREALAYYDSWLAFNQRYQRVPGVQAAVYAGDGIAFSGGVRARRRGERRTADRAAPVPDRVALEDVHRDGRVPAGRAGPAAAGRQGVPARHRDRRYAAGRADHPGAAGARRRRHPGQPGRATGGSWRRASRTATSCSRSCAHESSAVLPENDRFKYSNIGYGLLGLVVEAAAGTSYNSYVQTAIVDKLGLSGLGPELDPARLSEYAAGYSALSYADQRVPIEHVDTRALASATGFFGNARDLVTYFSAHLPGDDRLLSDKSKREMQHPLWKTGEDDGPRYGLGLQVTKVGDREVFGHGGGYPGHITRTLVDGERRIVGLRADQRDRRPGRPAGRGGAQADRPRRSRRTAATPRPGPLHRPLREPVGRHRHRRCSAAASTRSTRPPRTRRPSPPRSRPTATTSASPAAPATARTARPTGSPSTPTARSRRSADPAACSPTPSTPSPCPDPSHRPVSTVRV